MLTLISTLTKTITGKMAILLLFVFLPMLILSLVINARGAGSLKQEISNSMEQRASYYLSLLEGELDRVDRIQREFVTDDDLLMLSVASPVMSEYKLVEANNRLFRKFVFAKNATRYIENTGVFIPSLDKTISAMHLYGDPLDEALASMGNLRRTSRAPFVIWHGRLFVLTRYPDAGVFNNAFLLYTELSVRELESDMEQFKTYASGGSVLFAGHNEWLVSAPGSRDLGQGMIEELWRTNEGPDTHDHSSGVIHAKGIPYAYAASYSDKYDVTLFLFAMEREIVQPLNKYRLWLWVIALGSSVVAVASAFWLYRVVHKPMRQLVMSFRRVESGQFGIVPTLRGSDEFAYLFNQFDSMVLKLRELIRDNYEKELRSQRAEMKQLQAQINPHFLYNAFFLLYQMVDGEDYDNLKPYTRSLGEYFRYVTRNANEEAALEQEAAFTKAYLDIQRIRFGSRLRIHFEEVPERFRQLLIPRLTLQPIVENAIKYGLESKAEGGFIRVAFSSDRDTFCISITDSGHGLPPVQLRKVQQQLSLPIGTVESTGLLNVHHRIRLRYGKLAKVVLEEAKEGGTAVSIMIPLGGVKDVPAADY